VTFDVRERRYPTYRVYYRCCRHCLLDHAHGPDRNLHPSPCGGVFGFCSGGGDEWSQLQRVECEFCGNEWWACRCPLGDRLAQAGLLSVALNVEDEDPEEWCPHHEDWYDDCPCYVSPSSGNVYPQGES